ncbi:MAG: hypothetical protein IJ783_06305 [Kiritimatiellae bacterium]|nr:hypothetical protein [Kiritimatiellia bacterium]
MAQNYATKYASKVVERFKKESITNRAAGNDYSFAGAQTVVIGTVDTVALNDFNRTAASNRFGAVANLGNTKQELQMTQDKSFTFAIDAGDQSDTASDMSAGKALRREIDEVVTPHIDKYRLGKWADGAGTVVYSGSSSALTKATVLSAIIDVGGELSNALVPDASRTLYIPTRIYKLLVQADAVISLESLGTKAVGKGEVGEVDGNRIVKVPDSWFPTGVEFMIKYKNCTVDPIKFAHYRVLREAQGFDGPVVEGRLRFDSFVKEAVSAGIGVYKVGTKPASGT